MPQTEKFPIGSLVTQKNFDAPLRVVGYDGLKAVIVQLEQDYGDWKKGWVGIAQTKDLRRREEVKHIPGEPEDENGQAIGWMELGGLSVAITRAGDGAVLVQFERAPGYPEEYPVTVRVSMMKTGDDLWEGDIT